MWFAASDGLNKYDGYSFTVYFHDPHDTASLGDDDVAYVYEDVHEQLWICTRKGGIDLFDRENQQFHHIKKSTANSSSSNNNYSITEDKYGVLWIGTPQGIDRMVVTAKNPANGKKLTFFSTHTVQLTHKKLDNVFETPEKSIYPPKFFTDSRGNTFICNSNTIYQLYFNHNQQTYSLLKRLRYESGKGHEAADLTEDITNHPIFMHSDNGIFRFSDTGFGPPQLIYKHTKYNDMWGLDYKGSVWINENSGITRLKPASCKWERIIADNSELSNLIKYTYCFYTDRTGVLWIGTSGYGILKYDPAKERFHAILPNEYVYKIFEGRDGKIVVQDLYELSISKNETVKVNLIIDKKVLSRYPAPSSINYTCLDKKGNFWFCLPRNLLKQSGRLFILI